MTDLSKGHSAYGHRDPDAAAHYELAVDHLLHFRSEVGDEIAAAESADPGMVMVHVFNAYLGLLGTEPRDASAAATVFARWRAKADRATFSELERYHVESAAAWLDGDMRGAGLLLRRLSISYPRDVLALAVGHQIDFLSGDAVTLRDRIGGALSSWHDDEPQRANLLGMYAFGLEESGQYDRARDVGLSAVDADGADVWGIHAVTHTYEMTGDLDGGVGFLDAHVDSWSTGNYLNVHSWWHRCLFGLELGQRDLVLEIYDAVLHNAESAGLAMEMLDAAALLWRMHLDGDDQTSRWLVLAAAWDPVMDQPHYAFNDMHAVMSYVGAGQIGAAEQLIDRREQWVLTAPKHLTNATMTAEVGLPVCRAIVDFGRGRYDSVVDGLAPLRYRFNECGGSHAQRDAIARTLLEAAIRSGRTAEARMLASERINLKPCSPYNWRQVAAVARQLGEQASAALAPRLI